MSVKKNNSLMDLPDPSTTSVAKPAAASTAAKTPDEVIPPSSPLSLIPINDADYDKALPKEREACFLVMEGDVESLSKNMTYRMWHVGKIISTLESRKEKDVMKEAQRRCGYADRTLYTAKAFFDKFPKFADIKPLAAKMDWSYVRQLMTVKKTENLQQLKAKIEDGELSKEELPAAVKEVAEQERQESGKTGDMRTRKQKDKVIDIVAVFHKSAAEITRMKTDLLKMSKDMLGSGAKDKSSWVGILTETEMTPDERYKLAKKHVDKIAEACQEIGATVVELMTTLKKECP